MGLFSRAKAKIKIQTTKKDSFSGWLKCTHCHELIHTREIEQHQHCCPKCDYHYRISPEERIRLLADADSFEELFADLSSVDPLQFVDTQPYTQRLKESIEKTGALEGVIVGVCCMQQRRVAVGVMNFLFMGGSMGSVIGEKITRLIEHALTERLPLLLVSTSGGARMQESMLSLMQMAKTAAALSRLHAAKIPFISVLTNPTSGGVTASFASLGDVILAEPNALICFAGPRVIEQTLNQVLPPDAQKSEFLLHHGMIDAIVRRPHLRDTLIDYFKFLCKDPAS